MAYLDYAEGMAYKLFMMIIAAICIAGCSFESEEPQGTLKTDRGDVQTRIEKEILSVYKGLPRNHPDDVYQMTATLWESPPQGLQRIDLKVTQLPKDPPSDNRILAYIKTQEQEVNEKPWPTGDAWQKVLQTYYDTGLDKELSYINGDFAPNGQTIGTCYLSFRSTKSDQSVRFDLCLETALGSQKAKTVQLVYGPGALRTSPAQTYTK